MTPTFFGPVISGTINIDKSQPSQLYNNIISTYTTQGSFHEQPNMDYSDLWKLPGIGIDELQTNEELNKQIIANFYSTVQLKNGKIYIQFPWKSNKHCLADNYNLALSRLHQLCKMRIKNPECWEEYCNIIQEQKDKHFIEEAPHAWKTICEQTDGFILNLPRTILSNYEDTQYELHTFVDASARAYATVAYLRLISHQGKITSAIVMARQRLAPINAKTMTIPRLELLALLIGVRLTNFLLKELKLHITTTRIYSDSQAALHWVQSQTKNGHKDEESPEREVQANSTIFINTSLKQFPSTLLTKFSNLKTLQHITVYDKLPKDAQDIIATKLPEVTKISATTP
ncbi:Pao retrotransposon peptidase, partial [Ostertagia ostertagi]